MRITVLHSLFNNFPYQLRELSWIFFGQAAAKMIKHWLTTIPFVNNCLSLFRQVQDWIVIRSMYPVWTTSTSWLVSKFLAFAAGIFRRPTDLQDGLAGYFDIATFPSSEVLLMKARRGWYTRPPTLSLPSIIVTFTPCWRRVSAQRKPATPAPTMQTCGTLPLGSARRIIGWWPPFPIARLCWCGLPDRSCCNRDISLSVYLLFDAWAQCSMAALL